MNPVPLEAMAPAGRTDRHGRERSAEQRSRPRIDLHCPLRLFDVSGETVAVGSTENLSEGGLYAVIPVESLPGLGEQLNIELALPAPHGGRGMRAVHAPGRVIRHEALEEFHRAGVAIRFLSSVALTLES
jgi:hypothetical protein